MRSFVSTPQQHVPIDVVGFEATQSHIHAVEKDVEILASRVLVREVPIDGQTPDFARRIWRTRQTRRPSKHSRAQQGLSSIHLSHHHLAIRV